MQQLSLPLSWEIRPCSALDMLTTLEDESVTTIITDPPYDDLEDHRRRGTTTRLTKRWFPTISKEEILAVVKECWRVLEPRAHIYLMCNYEAVWGLEALIEQETRFAVPKSLIWDKVSIGMGYNYRSQHEHILFLKKGKRPINNRSIGDVLRFKRIHPSHATYPTEKPVELLEVLVTQSSNPGDLVVDPFSGSGAVGVAALRQGRRFLGCDIAPEGVELSRSRLSVIS